MKETTQNTDAEYRLYERLRLAGHSVRIQQIRTCPHCERPYRVAFCDGSSKTHCKEDVCRLASTGAKKQQQQKARSARYYECRKLLTWKHDKTRQSAYQRRNLAYHTEFAYV